MNLIKWAQVFKLKNSFVLVFILIQMLLILLTVIFYKQTAATILEAEEQSNKMLIAGVYDKLDEVQKLADAVAIVTSKNTALLNIFAKHDREAVRPVMDSIWADLKPLGFGQLQLYYKPDKSPDWKFFYRAQTPERFDDSADNRANLAKSNLTNALVSGLLQGTTGFGFRAVTPLTLNSKQIGSLETGFELGGALLERLVDNYSGNWAIYNLSRGSGSLNDRALIEAVGDSKDKHFKNLMPDENVIKSAKAGATHTELDEKINSKIIYIPIANFQGDYVALLKYVGTTQYFDALAEVRDNAILICALGFLLSSGIIFLLFRMITVPIKGLVIETGKIKNFELDGTLKIPAKLGELKELIDAMNAMKIGLRSFKKYIPAELVQQLIRNGEEIDASGERRRLTIFFSDIADFSTISEKLTPNELSSYISEYLTEMTAIILKHGGTVDKYIGDSIMAFWAPQTRYLNTRRRLVWRQLSATTDSMSCPKSGQGRGVLCSRLA